MLKYGLKLWSVNKEWFREAVGLVSSGQVDFVELYIVPNSFELKDLEVFRGVPVSIHAPHWQHHFNLFELTEDKIKLFQDYVIKTADFLESQFIILHAGAGESPDIIPHPPSPLLKGRGDTPLNPPSPAGEGGRGVGKLKFPDNRTFQKNIKRVTDERILIENLTKIGLDGRTCFGYSLDQLQFIKNDCALDICFDFAHAAKAALSQKLPYKDFIKKIITCLQPCYFHLCGTYFNTQTDEHQNLFEGDLDMKWAKKVLVNLAKKRALYLVFEVPKKGNNLKNDIKNIAYFKSL